MFSKRAMMAAAAAFVVATPVRAQSPVASGPSATVAASTPAAASGFMPIAPSPGANIVAELQASGEFTTLIKGLTATNLMSLVQGTQNLTLIAPTDAAFAALPPDQLDALMKDPAKLQAVLTYHLVATRVALKQIQGHSSAPVTTAAQKPVIFDGATGDVKINGQTALQSGVPASNGLIYVVGQVLTPPA